MTALYLKELRSFLGSIIGYIFIAIFLVTNSLFLWVFSGDTNVIEGGTADLKGFFLISPLILCVLVPAITMRSFSEEKRTGTIELLYTKPISDFSIILSKYLAGVTLVFISLLPTLLYLVCIHYLGDTMSASSDVSVVDDAAAITSYIGLFLVGACFVAIGTFSSATTNSQIVSFILAMFLCWFLFFGLDLLAVYSQFGSLDILIKNLGFMEHYHAIQKGVLDFKDVVYFLTVIILFLLFSHLRLASRKLDGFKLLDMRPAVLQVRLAIVGLFLVNYIVAFFVLRWDLTEDKRHSLSPNTIAMLEDEDRINDRIFFKVYLEGDLPADIRKIRNAVQEKLDEFIIYSGDKIQYEFIDPNGDEDADYNLEVQKNIYSEGIRPCDMEIISSGEAKVNTIWPGALIEYKGMTVDQVQFFNRRIIRNNEDLTGLAERAINNLEYKLISAVRRVTAESKKTVAFLQGQGELDAWQTADVRNSLKRYYLIEDVEIGGQINALNDVDALIVAQPKERFTEKDKFVIDQFIMNGGRVMWFVDPLDVNRDSLYYTGQTFGIGYDLNIEKDMIYKYGVRLNPDVIIDKECGPLYVPGHPLEVVDWYFYPLLEREDLNGKTHAITKNIDPIKSEYASSLDIVNEEDTNVKKTVLLKSSYNSQIFRSPARINYGIIDVDPKFNDGSEGRGDYPVAVLLEGRFSSPFENRISTAFAESSDFKTKYLSDSTKMLVVSDGDIIRNEVDSALFEDQMRYRAIPLNVDVFGVMNQNGTPKYAYGNRDFVLNSLDYLLEDHSLLDIRTKTITLRMLDPELVSENKNFWKTFNIMMPLFLLALMAFVQYFVRRERYAK
ncbi:MAG: gliding motility-associated ABC transporter substrate-binding protein GldG [Flavobacteriales bacterium]|nr:gliding motility-associated ABC transporter substrate-binding protein GldG [Flavobacteriales bacterium]